MVINLKLSPKGIKDAQKQVDEYKDALVAKTNKFVRRMAALGVEIAKVRFANAAYAGNNDVVVSVKHDGSKATIIAEGKSVAFIEFGTGAYEPSMHPLPLFKRGEYGKGLGKKPQWVYKGDKGNSGVSIVDKLGRSRDGYYKTYGNPPAMAMWGAVEEMAAQTAQIWRDTMHD